MTQVIMQTDTWGMGNEKIKPFSPMFHFFQLFKANCSLSFLIFTAKNPSSALSLDI